MTTVSERYRENALRMGRLARFARTDAEREIFLSFALTWKRLAEDAEGLSAPPELEEPSPSSTPERYFAHAEELEAQARAARTPEERDLFLDMAARWRQLADEAGDGGARSTDLGAPH
jgi:hypothetical protein